MTFSWFTPEQIAAYIAILTFVIGAIQWAKLQNENRVKAAEEKLKKETEEREEKMKQMIAKVVSQLISSDNQTDHQVFEAKRDIAQQKKKTEVILNAIERRGMNELSRDEASASSDGSTPDGIVADIIEAQFERTGIAEEIRRVVAKVPLDRHQFFIIAGQNLDARVHEEVCKPLGIDKRIMCWVIAWRIAEKAMRQAANDTQKF
jgi:hypothetical protein